MQSNRPQTVSQSFRSLDPCPYQFNSAYQNVLRWWNNIASYKSEFASLPAGSASAAPAAAEEDDDDVDLFASDDEVDEEAEKIKVSHPSLS